MTHHHAVPEPCARAHRTSSLSRSFPLTVLFAAMLLSACGGDGDSAPSAPSSGNTPPASSTPAADKTPPTVSAAVNVSSDTVSFTATTSDNVGVTSVTFTMDGGTLQGTVQKSPSDGTYSLQTPINIIGAGSHTLSATASDAAGNSATSAVVSFTVGNPSSDGPDTTPPAVTAAVEGNFGLVKLTALATDDRNVDGVSFTVDGIALSSRATRAYLTSDPDNQYFKRFDTTGLPDGTHVLVARATDRAFNQTDSTQVTFDVNSSAGLIEVDSNNTIATATPLTRSQLQVAGTVNTVKKMIGDSIIYDIDTDYYQISLAAGETVNVKMLSNNLFFLAVVDSTGTRISTAKSLIASDVSNVTYTNGNTPQIVYIYVSSGPADFLPDNQYKLSLTYQ